MNFRLALGPNLRRWQVGGTLLVVLVGCFWLGMAGRSRQVEPKEQPGPQVTEAFGGPLWLVVMGEKKPLSVGQPLPPAAGLVLESGRLQVTWPDGTIARLEGPTAWRLEDGQQSTLQDGRLLVVPPPKPTTPRQWHFPGGRAVVAAGGTLFVDVARDRTVRLVQLEGESLVFRPKQPPDAGDRPELRLGSASQLTVRADGRWEIPTVLVAGAIARLLGSTVLLEGFGRKLAPLALQASPTPPRPVVSVRPSPPPNPTPVVTPAPPPETPPEPWGAAPSAPERQPEPYPEPWVPAPAAPERQPEPAPPPAVLPLVPSPTVTLPQPQFAPPLWEPLPVESPATEPLPLEPVEPERAATETF
ncbi:MAG: hypothetical protein ACUVSQ_06260 [Pseudanabaenaceae cyanobacterium]